MDARNLCCELSPRPMDRDSGKDAAATDRPIAPEITTKSYPPGIRCFGGIFYALIPSDSIALPALAQNSTAITFVYCASATSAQQKAPPKFLTRLSRIPSAWARKRYQFRPNDSPPEPLPVPPLSGPRRLGTAKARGGSSGASASAGFSSLVAFCNVAFSEREIRC